MHVETILIVFKAPSFISLIQKENIRIKMLKLIKFIFSISMVFAFRTPGIEKLLFQTVPDILTDCVGGRHIHFTVEDCMFLTDTLKINTDEIHLR